MGMVVGAETARKMALASGKMKDAVTIKIPPSANELYVVRGPRRIKSRKYIDWIKEVTPQLVFLKSPTSYPCQYGILIHGKVNERRDGGNCEKALLDACQVCGVIPEDNLKHIRSGFWEYQPAVDIGLVTVWFEPYQERKSD